MTRIWIWRTRSGEVAIPRQLRSRTDGVRGRHQADAGDLGDPARPERRRLRRQRRAADRHRQGQVADLAQPPRSTSCSPFTATVIGMLFDPSRATKGDSFQPMYDNGKVALPHAFYSMHQGNYFGG